MKRKISFVSLMVATTLGSIAQEINVANSAELLSALQGQTAYEKINITSDEITLDSSIGEVFANQYLSAAVSATIDGNSSHKGFYVLQDNTLSLENLTLSNFYIKSVQDVEANGSALYNTGTVNLYGTIVFDSNSIEVGDEASPGGAGGAIYNMGTINAANGTTVLFENNKAIQSGDVPDGIESVADATLLNMENGKINFGENSIVTFRGNQSSNRSAAFFNAGEMIFGAGTTVEISQNKDFDEQSNSTIFTNTGTLSFGGEVIVMNNETTSGIYSAMGTITFKEKASFLTNKGYMAVVLYMLSSSGELPVTIFEKNAEFIGNTAANSGGGILGSAVNVGHESTLIFKADANFTDNSSISEIDEEINGNGNNGGALYLSISETEFHGNVLFKNNQAYVKGTPKNQMASNGGGAISAVSAKMTFVDNAGKIEFNANAAGSDLYALASMGGAILAQEGEISFGKNLEVIFKNNSAKTKTDDSGSYAHGGAILVNKTTLTFDEGTTVLFESNSASDVGGALMNVNGNLTSAADMTFTGNKVLRNLAEGDIGGGAIANNNAEDTKTIFNGSMEFTSNESASNGGAIYNARYGDMSLNKTADFTTNTAANDGGAVYNNGGNITITDASFTSNSAGGKGGAIYNESVEERPSTLTLKAVTKDIVFSGNTATEGGNDLYNNAIVNIQTESGKRVVFNSTIAGSSERKGEIAINGVGKVEFKGEVGNQTILLNSATALFDNASISTSTLSFNGGRAEFVNDSLSAIKIHSLKIEGNSSALVNAYSATSCDYFDVLNGSVGGEGGKLVFDFNVEDDFTTEIALLFKVIAWAEIPENLSKYEFAGGAISGYIFDFARVDADGVYLNYIAVPEPAAWAVLLGVFALVLAQIYRRKKV